MNYMKCFANRVNEDPNDILQIDFLFVNFIVTMSIVNWSLLARRIKLRRFS